MLTEARVAAALRVSFGIAFAAAIVDPAFGLIIAWVLTRYRFPGRRVSMRRSTFPSRCRRRSPAFRSTALYAPNGWIGSLLAPLGVKIAFTPLGIFVALVFVGLPFAVRTVQPLIEEIDREQEEAAATLGAGRAGGRCGPSSCRRSCRRS